MQNYGQSQGYQRPGTATGFSGQGYAAPQGYPSTTPQTQAQWTAPNPGQNTNQWNPPQQQAAGGYNPSNYGIMPGGYAQGHQNVQPPLPPRPKPHGFAGAVQNQIQQQQQQQNTQNWTQPPPPPPPLNTTFTPPQQGGYPVQGGSQQTFVQSIPPSSATTGLNYIQSPATKPAHTSYGAPQSATSSWPQGQPAQYQTGHAQNYTYTKPGQEYQGHQPQQPYRQSTPNQFAAQGQQTQQASASTNQFPQQQPYGQTVQSHDQFQQPPQQAQYSHVQQAQHVQQPPPYSQQQGQWQSPAPTVQGFGHQQTTQTPGEFQQQPAWQPGQHAQGFPPGRSTPQANHQDIQAPKPLSLTDTASSSFFNQSSPQSQPVSPVNSRQSVSLPPKNQAGLGRTASVSSVALANLQAQRAHNRTNSPRPASVKVPTPPPPRDDKSKFSVLGAGGPSDWEHFGADDDEVNDDYAPAKNGGEKKAEPTLLDCVELPAQLPSVPLNQGWSNSAAHSTPPNVGAKGDSYIPTPPPTTSSPVRRSPSQPPQPGFVAGDAVAPLNILPRPTQAFQPPVQQNFTMEGGAPATQPIPFQDIPRQQLTEASLVQNHGGWGSQISNQAQDEYSTRPGNNHIADLRAKEEALESLRVEFEKSKSDNESVKRHAAEETRALRDQIEAMQNASAEAKSEADATLKEKDKMIEKLREDVEGKEHNIRERDAQVADLRQQIEVERRKEPAKPTPADLIPDINSWYISSLERYIAMLRGEESEVEVENKKKLFKAFLRAESAIRGIEYHDTPPPPAPVHDAMKSPLGEQTDHVRGTPNESAQRLNLNSHVPVESSLDGDDYDISPGGRPIFRSQGSLPSKEGGVRAQQHSPPSEPLSSTPLTAAREDDASVKSAIQTAEEQAKSQYKAYVPSAVHPQNDATSPARSKPTPLANPPVAVNTSGAAKGGDEVFFGVHAANVDRPSSSGQRAVDFSIPAPLSLSTNRPDSTAASRPSAAPAPLADLLPASIVPAGHNQFIERLQSRMAAIKTDPSNVETLTKTWEKSASLIRRKNDSARRARQEESEERNEELFNNNEISYAEISQWEADQKEKEGALKAQEDQEEYKSYVKTVFDPVYDGLQADIKLYMDLYMEAESMLPTSVAGVKSFQGGDSPSTKVCLELLIDMHGQIEKKYQQVVSLVAERDKRYKKTEIQPLYAAGNIAVMKKMEKHFEEAERQAVLGARREKAERVGELVHMAEDVVVGAVGVEQTEIDHILDAIKALDEGKGDETVLKRAQTVLANLKSSSKMLLELFHGLEVELNDAIHDAEVAEAHAASADAARIQELEDGRVAEAQKMTDEYKRRVQVLEQDDEEIESLIARKEGNRALQQEREKEQRLKTALEEAKRRNGHV